MHTLRPFPRPLAALTLSLLALGGCRDPDGDGYRGESDCDPLSGDVNPDQSEIPYNGADDDCDPATLDDDLDGDGWGIAWDCDESDPEIHPDAPEVCDGIDNDCSGRVDDGVGDLWYVDEDGDGWGAAEIQSCDGGRYAAQGGDCDDGDGDVNPGAVELCDQLDNDCDDATDEGLEAVTVYPDADGDGYGDDDDAETACDVSDGYASVGGDCDDGDGDLNPGAVELCDDADNDCDDAIDEDAALRGEQSICPAESCAAIEAVRGEGGDGIWWLDPGALGEPFEARCQSGWTLLGSFVNDDGADWTVEDWTAESSFGAASDAELSDHRSPAAWRLEGTDLRAEDSEGGWIVWEGALEGTLNAALSDGACEESPREVDAVSSSSADAASALLSFWGSDPETGTCALDDEPADAAALGAFHDGCGAWGFGQRTSDGGWLDHAFCLSGESADADACGDWFGHAGLAPPAAEGCGAALLWAR